VPRGCEKHSLQLKHARHMNVSIWPYWWVAYFMT
jgi:hypothetical protein